MKGNTLSFSYVSSEMRTNGDNIRKWSQQNDNPLLQACAIEVLTVFEAGGGSKCQ